MCPDLVDQNTVIQLSEPGQLPQGLSRLYECWFQHRFPDPAHYEQKIRPLLELLLAAREPLPISLAARALALDTYGARAVDELGSFCRKANDTLTLYHKSLRDWLSDPEAAGWDFVASEAEGHKRMASVLLQAYAARQAAGAAFQSAAGWEQLGSTAIPYALRHLPAHLASAGEPHARVGVLTDFALALRRCKPEILNSLLEDYREAVAASDQSVMNDWVDCIKTSTHLLRRGNDTWPAYKILLQIAMDHADESAITKAAEAWLETGACDWLWLHKVNRPPSVKRTGLLSVMEGHTSGVNGAQLLPDGRVLSWSDDHTLRLWDGVSGEPLGVMEGHTHGVKGTQLLPDGRVLSWSDDHTLRIWDIESCKQIQLSSQPWVITSAYPCAWEGAVEQDLAGATKVGDYWIQSYDKALIIADRKNHIHALWQGPKATYADCSDNKIIAYAGKNLFMLQLMQGSEPVPIHSVSHAA